MRRLLLSTIALAATLAVTTGIALAEPNPEFRLGFKALAELIPNVVGEPMGDERYDPDSGNTVQITTRGIMVWRKFDNRTAFTNGSTTWVLGPRGLESRPNSARLDWEGPDGLVDVGTIRGLDIAPSLRGALTELRSVDGGDWLARVAAEHGVVVREAPIHPDILGTFDLDAGLVTINSHFREYSARVRAAILAHELQHAAQLAAGEFPTTPAQCYRAEAQAFERQATVWSELWQNNLPPATNALIAEMNEITRLVAHNPEAFLEELMRRYSSECGPLQ